MNTHFCPTCHKVTDGTPCPFGHGATEEITQAPAYGITAHRDTRDIAVADALVCGAIEHGGHTVWVGEKVDHGYLVGIPALAPNPNNLPIHKVSTADIAAWVPAVLAVEYVATIGSWIDTDTDLVAFDACSHYANLQTALIAAQNRGELAVWDIANAREIRVADAVDHVPFVGADGSDPL